MVRFRNTEIQVTELGEIYLSGLKVQSLNGEIMIIDGEMITVEKVMNECYPHGKPPQTVHRVVVPPESEKVKPKIVGEMHHKFTGYWVYDGVWFTTSQLGATAAGIKNKANFINKCKHKKDGCDFIPKESVPS